MFDSQDPEAKEICPYNPSHSLLKYRMDVHLARCRRQYHDDNAMIVCIFNSNHRVPKIEREYHLRNCPNRLSLDKHIYVTNTEDENKFPIHAVEVHTEDNWDEENCPSYQPQEYCMKNPVLRQTKIESASVRKNFRIGERQRIQNLTAAGPSNIQNGGQEPPKFHSTPLATTSTNVGEESPFSLNDIRRIVQSQAPKSIIADPNYSKSSGGTNKVASSENVAPTCDINNDHSPPSSSAGISNKEKMDEDGFIMPRQKEKTRRGRGRGFKR